MADANRSRGNGAAWVKAGEYSLKLEAGKIIARNAKGRILKAVPAKVKKLEPYEKLDNLRIFLEQHEQLCQETVRGWFLAGQSVPLSVIIQVWEDEYWKKYLADMLISNGNIVGLLRSASAEGVQVVDLDGETTLIEYSDSATVVIPHPALIDDLEDWREFAVELGVHQGFDQLFRDVYQKPADADGQKAAVSAYSDGEYERYTHLMGRSRGGGFVITMGSISTSVREGESTITATMDIDGWDPSATASLGELSFSLDGQVLPLAEVGPVAWSEGIRMCEYVYSGRTIQENPSNI